jgi:hypothetical protein
MPRLLFTALPVALLSLCAGAADALMLNPPVIVNPVDTLIARHVEARGGSERLHAIQSLKRQGHLVIPGMGMRLELSEWQGRGGHYRQDVTLQGLTAIEATDGHDGWQVSPFEGRKDAAHLSEDEIKDLILKSDFEFPFVNYKSKGHHVTLGAREDIDGTPADALNVHLADGNEATYWIDPDTHMVIRALIRETVRGAEDVTEIDYGEYQQVGGVWMPMTEEIGGKGSDPARRQKLVFESALVNPAVAATLYTFPTTAPAAGSHP